MTEWIAEKIAYLLPKRVLYFAVIRVGADATCTTFSSRSPCEVSITDLLLHMRQVQKKETP